MTKQSEIVTVGQMPVDGKQKVTESMKKRFEIILCQEFDSRRTKYAFELDNQKRAIMEDYRKKSGIVSKVEKYNELKQLQDDIITEMADAGFTKEGYVRGVHEDSIPDVIKGIIKEYKEKVDFKGMLAQYKTAEKKTIAAYKAIRMTGLTLGGEIRSSNDYTDNEERDVIIKLNQKLHELETAANPLNNLRNKLITRLWMANTMIEVNAIMYEVMGNNEMPAVTRDMLPAPEAVVVQ